MVEQGDYWEMLLPSEFAAPTPALEALADELDVRRRDDPLMVLHQLNEQIYRLLRLRAEVDQSRLAHRPGALLTHDGRLPGLRAHHDHAGALEAADSVPLRQRLSVPRRQRTTTARSPPRPMPGSRRCCRSWAGSALIRRTGWSPGDRHIRTAIGRDYADVPPTHGIFRGRPRSELTVAVRVTPSEGTPALDQELPVPEDWSILVEKAQALPEQPPALRAAADGAAAAGAPDRLTRFL